VILVRLQLRPQLFFVFLMLYNYDNDAKMDF